MASLAWVAHPRMMDVLDKYGMRDSLPLTTFLDILRSIERKEKPEVPDGVSRIALAKLIQAYEYDEEEINAQRESQRASRTGDFGD